MDSTTAITLADKLVGFLETNEAPEGLFQPDVFCDFTLPEWRLQRRGIEEVVALRKQSHPALGRVPRRRVDTTSTGFVIEFEERWHDHDGDWYCREMIWAEVVDGAISELSVYCTGDWDEDLQARHAREVELLRP